MPSCAGKASSRCSSSGSADRRELVGEHPGRGRVELGAPGPNELIALAVTTKQSAAVDGGEAVPVVDVAQAPRAGDVGPALPLRHELRLLAPGGVEPPLSIGPGRTGGVREAAQLRLPAPAD